MVTIRNKASSKIIEKLRLNKEKIVSKEEIFRIIRDFERIYKIRVNLPNIWTYLRKSFYIKRVLGDYYYVCSLEERHNNYCKFSENELIFLVLEKMKIKWYLGLENALKENKITWQALNVSTIVNSKFSGIKKLGNSKFKFIKTKRQRFTFGIIKNKTNNQVKFFYSDLDKTYLDFLNFYSRTGKDLRLIKKNMDFKVDKDKLKRYSKNYPNKIQRII